MTETVPLKSFQISEERHWYDGAKTINCREVSVNVWYRRQSSDPIFAVPSDFGASEQKPNIDEDDSNDKNAIDDAIFGNTRP